MKIPSEYRLPAEFEPHRATWLLWPTRPDNWRCEAYFAQSDTLGLAALIAHGEPVRLGASPADAEKLRGRVPPKVSVVAMDFNDAWVRDTGPTALVADSHPPIAVDWRFNSWGGLFSESHADDQVAAEIAQYEQLSVIKAPVVLEGGAVISDGKGTIIATEESVLAENRNPGLTKSEAERVFSSFLNARKVIWLPYGLKHDESGGHIDNVCAFASDQVILLSVVDDASHPSHARMRVARDILKRSRNASGVPFHFVEIPLPEPTFITAEEAAGFRRSHGTIVRTVGSPLAPSYINFFVTNAAVFVPTFNLPSDEAALQMIGAAFPGRLAIPYRSREFLLGGGALHCLTKEIPA